jgi:hypothetical protein
MAPCGDGRHDGTFADFYGSMLLGFSIEHHGTPFPTEAVLASEPSIEDRVHDSGDSGDSNVFRSLWQPTQTFDNSATISMDQYPQNFRAANDQATDTIISDLWPNFDFPILESPFHSGSQDASLDWLLGGTTTTGDSGGNDPSLLWPGFCPDGVLPWAL